MGERNSDSPYQVYEKYIWLIQDALKKYIVWSSSSFFNIYFGDSSSQAAVSAQATSDATPAQPAPSQPLNLARLPGEEPPPAANLVARENRPMNENVQMNAQGGPVLNEEDFNRDWLDWMYTFSRAAILLSIVYFYSSFSRFVMVMGAMLLVYLWVMFVFFLWFLLMTFWNCSVQNLAYGHLSWMSDEEYECRVL